MRTRKPILLYCADVHLLSAISYALRLHPYEVSAFSNGADVFGVVDENKTTSFACGVLIHAQQGDLAGRLIHRILNIPVAMPLLLVDRAGDLAPVRYADMVLYGHNTSMAHIFAALEVLCTQKQGTRSRSVA